MFIWFAIHSSVYGQTQSDSPYSAIELNDSSVGVHLRMVDSIRGSNLMLANVLVDSVLHHYQGNNKEILSSIYSRKWKILSLLSRHTDAINFVNGLIAKGNNDPDLYLALASEYRFNNEYSKALLSAQEAVLKYRNKGDDIGVVEATNNLIKIYGELGMFDQTRQYFSENLILCNKIQYEWGLAIAYQEYGRSQTFKNPALAYELLTTGKKIAESVGQDKICSFSIYLIKYYINTNKVSEAKKEIKEFLQNCGNNLSQTSNVLTLMAHIYSLVPDYDSAIIYNNKALELRLINGNGKMIANSYMNLARDYMFIKNFNLANENLDKAEQIIKNIDDKEITLTYYQEKRRYYELKSQFKDAFYFSQKELDLNKKLANARHQTALAKLKAVFDIQQKNILLEKELQQKTARERLVVIVLLILLFLAILAYGFFLYSKKSHSYLKLVSKAKNIEKKLFISDKERIKLQSVFEYSVTGILILNKEGFIQYANRKSKELLDQNNAEHLSRIPFADFFDDSDKDKVQEALLNIFMSQASVGGFKVQVVNKNTFHWLDISLAPLKIEHEDENVLVTMIDVTQEVLNMGKEQKQNQILQTLLNSVTETIVFVHRNGKIKALNNTAAARMNAKTEELIESLYFDKIPEDIRAKRMAMFDKVLRSKKPLIEVEMDGRFNNLISMYPNLNSDANVDYVSVFVQDITERRQAEEQIDNLKQRVLRSQMNPHFIFNSLTSIQSFVIRNDAILASKYLNSFARLIRLILESSRYDFISLKNEIDILKYYLEIQKMRFSDNFEYSFEIDPELNLEDTRIPPMLAQPFIENAIEHGIQHLDTLGELAIKFIKDGSRLLFEVRDNGVGREASKSLNKESMFASKSLSTRIINDRLNALNKYSKDVISYNIIDLKDEQNNPAGTQVIISIPIEKFR